MTTSPYTLAPGTVEIAGSIVSENSITPDYVIDQYPLSVTVGLSADSELAVKSYYYYVKDEHLAGATAVDRKIGELELAYKWDFMPPREDSKRPSAALILAGMMPTENTGAVKINSISHWGMRAGVSAGTELGWNDHILGVYADVQMAFQDLTDSRLRDIYGIYNAGLLFPISKDRNLQMFIEHSIVHGRDRLSLAGADYSGFTYGLRLVSERFNFTMGTQILRKPTAGYENSDRIIGLISAKF
jgi:hypothetical protein